MVRHFRTLPLAAAVLAAVGAEPMAPTPARMPAPTAPSTHLVDRVIPAYGVIELDSTTRAGAFLARCRAFADVIEADEMAGTLHAAAPTAPAAANGDKRKKGDKTPPPANGDIAQLHALADELVALEQQLRPSDGDAALPVLEQWQLDEAYADLERAANALHLGLDDAAFNGLAQKHQAWLLAYQATVGPAREAKIKELMKAKKLSRSEAEEELAKEHWEAPYGAAADTAASATPAKAEPPTAAAQPAPAPAPSVAPPQKPAAAPQPAPAAVANEPAPTPEAPVTAPEASTVPEPAAAPEPAAPEMNGPETEAPATEAQPAPEAQPTETPKAEATKPAEPAKKTDEKPGDLPDL